MTPVTRRRVTASMPNCRGPYEPSLYSRVPVSVSPCARLLGTKKPERAAPHRPAHTVSLPALLRRSGSRRSSLVYGTCTCTSSRWSGPRAAGSGTPAARRATWPRGPWRRSRALPIENALQAAGVPVAAGTDPVAPGRSIPASSRLEVRGGFTPIQALQAAGGKHWCEAYGLPSDEGFLRPPSRAPHLRRRIV